jgi:hypothetical protein
MSRRVNGWITIFLFFPLRFCLGAVQRLYIGMPICLLSRWVLFYIATILYSMPCRNYRIVLQLGTKLCLQLYKVIEVQRTTNLSNES